MSRVNSQRKGCIDVFNSFLVSLAKYDGLFEFPIINATYEIPNRLISFSKAISCKDYDQWVHFYEDDFLFERIWKNQKKYLEILKKYNGVILPDFSVYRDMPLAMQIWNIYRSRAIGCWLQNNDIIVIPNIRYGDERTFSICCDGINKGCVISVGSHGTIKHLTDRDFFAKGLDFVVKKLEPFAIIVYGTVPRIIFEKYESAGIKIICFKSEFATSHKEVV